MLEHGTGAGPERVPEARFQQALVLSAPPHGPLARVVGRAFVVGVQHVRVFLGVVRLAGHHHTAEDAVLRQVLAGAVLAAVFVGAVGRV